MNSQLRKAVITGSTGMLGTALIKNLTERGYKVYAVSRPNSPRFKNIPISDSVTSIECDLKNIRELDNLVREKCDVFFHFGWSGTFGEARNDLNGQVDNIKHTIDAVWAAHDLGCKVFLGAGSQAEFGRKTGKISPDTPANPENGYGMAKLCAGQMSRLLCENLGMKHIWCRIFSVYGPNDGENTMVSSLIKKLLRGERPSCTQGEQIWDYLYCDDAAEAFRLAAEKGKDGTVYCVGSGEARLLREYITAMRDIISPETEIGFGDIPYGEKQVMYLSADTASLMRDTGFSPKVSFEEGIKKTADAMKNKL